MEIKCLSLGNPNDGFVNYFAHGECFDDFYARMLLDYLGTLPDALRLSEWQNYNGQQFTGRVCCFCSKALKEEETDTPT